MPNFALTMRHLLTLLLGLLALAACERPENFVEAGSVDLWPADTVKFDTIFTTLPSPTQRVYLYNTTGKPLRIRRVGVRGGAESPFRLTVDGVAGQWHDNVELAKGDSLIAFLTVRTDTRRGDHELTDDFVVETENGTTSRLIYAQVLDAYVIRSSSYDSVLTLPCDTTFTRDKPIIIDGPVGVAKGCTLTVEAGARLYFTSARSTRYGLYTSLLQVEGTLRVNEAGGDTVVFTNARLTKAYRAAAGQWGGVILTSSSRGNLIRRALIENASIGVRVDSVMRPSDQQPRLTIFDTELRNMANFALLGIGASDFDPTTQPSIRGWNLLAHNTGQSVLGLAYGGNYEFYHCTFYNPRSIGGGKSEPALGVNNFLRGSSGVLTYPTRLVLVNSVIWGTGKEELGFNFASGPRVETLFSHNLARTELAETDLPPGGGNRLNQDPQFKDPRKGDFGLGASSAARGLGLPFGQLPALVELRTDFAGRSRQDPPDAGCLEFVQ